MIYSPPREYMFEKKYQDFEEMISAIKHHVEFNGPTIIDDDEPKRLQIGFSCTKTSTRWLIGLSDVKKTGMQYRHLLNKEYRHELLNIINKNLWAFL